MKKITDFPVVRDQLAREAAEKAQQAAQTPVVYARAPGAKTPGTGSQESAPEAKR